MAGLTPPDIRAMVRDLFRRVDLLERRLSNLARRKLILDIPFSLDGVVYVSTSPPYYLADRGGTVYEVVVGLRVAGTSSTTVIVTKNGNTIATVTLASGETFKKVKLTSDFTGNQDRMNVQVTAPGTGATGLDVQVRAKIAA